uniref:Helicase C-terminal domain-containing protein n=1 Tax=Oryza meridionalis TaxID=40149 RepID=A0A0E0CQI7_9ORYZ
MIASSSAQSWIKGHTNQLARVLSSNALGSKLFRWCSRENHTSVRKLLEVDGTSERSKLLNKVSVLMGYSNTQELIEQERARRGSPTELISVCKEIEFPEMCAKFPCIKIGDSSPIELYAAAASMSQKETVLSENLTNFMRESGGNFGAAYEFSDKCHPLDPTLTNVDHLSISEESSLTAQSVSLEPAVDSDACPELLADATVSDSSILDRSIRCLPETTSRQYRQLEDGGFHTVRKLLQHFPRTYADLQNPQGSIEEGQYIMLFGTVVSSRGARLKHTLGYLEVVVSCSIIESELSSSVKSCNSQAEQKKTIHLHLKKFFSGTRFSSPSFLKCISSKYKEGDLAYVSGKIKKALTKDHYDLREYTIDMLEEEEQQYTLLDRKPYPIYPSKAGLKPSLLSLSISRALKMLTPDIDPMPREVLVEFNLPNLFDAYMGIHKPKNRDEADFARRRLIFDDFFYLQLGRLFQMLEAVGTRVEKEELLLKCKNHELNAVGADEWSPLARKLLKVLPYLLTPSQLNAVKEIIWDLRRPVPMNRLLQGDVGCGKTVVAFLACMEVISSGFQGLKTGEIAMVIGTHSLIGDKTEFSALRISVIDEQQRFGVVQRGRFNSKLYTPSMKSSDDDTISDENSDSEIFMAPHIFVVFLFCPNLHLDMMMSDELVDGGKVYLVYPIIEESEQLPQLHAAKAEFDSIKQKFEGYPCGLLHGRMRSDEKDGALSSFRSGETRILLSTQVIEIGVDVPDASMMMSKRKSPALAALADGNRLAGEEASGITARHPSKVFARARDLLAKPFPYVRSVAESLFLPYDLVPDARGAAAVRADDGQVYTVEEIVAMVLHYAAGLADAHVGAPVRDAVVAVPPYFGQAERRALTQAAQLAGVNVLALINEHAGAALQYGIDKDFSNESRHVIFYDMGAGSTYAALVYYSAYKAKEFGKTVSVNQFQVKDVRWDSKLGGLDMEMRLVNYFADQFNKQLGNGVDIRQSPKAMAKLKKQVKRTKEILSANTAAPISVESLYNDLDFRSTITREKFEELCEDLWEQALTPVKEVLAHSGMKIDDIYAVELIGGATRVPKLQAKLQEFLGRSDLDKHLDADEAIVLGASLHAANLSDGIKLNRKLGMIDGSTYGFVFEINGPDYVKDESTDQLLVPRMKKLGIKMFRSIRHTKDFDVSISYEKASELPPGVTSHKFMEYSVSGLTDASEKYSSRNLSAPIKANLHFSLSRSGIISLDRAEAVIEITEWVEVPKKNITLESNSTSQNLSSEGGAANGTSDSKENVSSDGDANKSRAPIDESNAQDIVTEKVLKKRTFRVPLKVVEKMAGAGSILSKELYSEAKTRLEALDKKDAERRRTAELKNNLESYIYSMKEKLEENTEILTVSTEQERESFAEKLNEVQDWLYMDGEDAQANEFKERLDQLKAIGDPILFRLSELKARPAACENARLYLAELQKIVKNWDSNKPWLPKKRVDEVVSEAEKVKTWLEEKEAIQKSTPVYSPPAFTSEEVYEKVLDLQDKVSSVNRIPKPKPKIEKKPPKEEESANKEKTETSESESKEAESTETSSESAAPEESQSEPQKTDDVEPEAHDELSCSDSGLGSANIHRTRSCIIVASSYSRSIHLKEKHLK